MAELQIAGTARDESCRSSPSPLSKSPVRRASWAIASAVAPKSLERRAQMIQANAQLDVGIDTRREHNSGVEQLTRGSVYARVRRRSKELLGRLTQSSTVGPDRRRNHSKEPLSEKGLAAAIAAATQASTGFHAAMNEVIGTPAPTDPSSSSSFFSFVPLSSSAIEGALADTQERVNTRLARMSPISQDSRNGSFNSGTGSFHVSSKPKQAR